MAVDFARRKELQDNVAQSAVASLQDGRSVLITAPTATGKTHIFTDIVDRMVEADPSIRILVTQDRIAIGRQNLEKAHSLGRADVSFSTEGRLDASGRVAYGTTPTLAANLERLGQRDLVIIDECHHAAEGNERYHSQIIAAVLRDNPKAVVLGLSACVSRADNARLHPALENADHFHITYNDALGVGAIVPPRTHTPNYSLTDGASIAETVDRFVDPNNPHEAAGGLYTALRKGRPVDFFQRSVREWRRANDGQTVPTLGYASTIADAETLRSAFAEAGLRTAIVHHGLPRPQIEKAFADFKNGKIDFLSSVDMLTEGFDAPNVRSIVCCKETTTWSEWLQINGRGARAFSSEGFDKREYTMIDMGASTYLHGSVDTLRGVENFALRGPDAEKRYRPWRCVEGGPDKDPTVYAMHDGRQTLFAVKAPGRNAYLLLCKEEVCVGRGAKPSTLSRTQRHPAAASGLLRGNDIRDLGRSIVRDRMDVFVTLESRKTRGMSEILKNSYAASRDNILRFAAQLAARPPARRTALSIA